MENNFFKIFSAFIIPLFICVSGCLKEERKTVRLVITTPIQEMNTISDPSIHDSPTFLARAANDFAAQYAGALVEPDIKTFNYVDEVRQFRYRNRAGYSFWRIFQSLRLH